jgi:hypothetical protein
VTAIVSLFAKGVDTVEPGPAGRYPPVLRIGADDIHADSLATAERVAAAAKEWVEAYRAFVGTVSTSLAKRDTEHVPSC